MADWLGQYIGTLPGWLAFFVIFFVALTWIWMATLGWKRDKYEWPEDKKKRLEKEKRKIALKSKKG